MIRNENLKTLSWEHHDGLVVALSLGSHSSHLPGHLQS